MSSLIEESGAVGLVERAPDVRPGLVIPPGRKSRPVLWWAAGSLVWLAVSVYLLVRWNTSGQFVRTSTGADPVPGYVRTSATVLQIFMPSVFAVLAWRFVVRPWRRAGHLTLDGKFMIALTLMWFPQDTFCNYMQTYFLYNSVLVNRGSWNPQLPGWISPHANHLPDPMLLFGFGYVVFMFPACILFGCWVLRKWQARRPATGKVGLFFVCAAAMIVADFVLELPFLRFQLYAFPGGIQSLSIWGGKTYQFPLNELVGWGLVMTTITLVRFHRDDRGRTVVERGIDQVTASPKVKQLISLGAIIAVVQLTFLVFNIGTAFFSANADEFPKGYKSWMLNGICGEGTGYPCPAPGVPIGRR